VEENGMMMMRKVEAIDVPAGGEVMLKPGGLHLMFIGLAKPLVEGETVAVTLVFEKAGEVALSLPIKSAGAMN
jgi:copper(I)-binding protein